MVKVIVSGAVLAVVSLTMAAVAWRLVTTSALTWGRREVRFAALGFALVVPAAVAAGFVDGKAAGIGGFILWGSLAGIALGAARFDNREDEDLEIETRWLLDIVVLVFVLATGFFGVLDFGMVYVPAAASLVMACRLSHLRHGGPLFPSRSRPGGGAGAGTTAPS